MATVDMGVGTTKAENDFDIVLHYLSLQNFQKLFETKMLSGMNLHIYIYIYVCVQNKKNLVLSSFATHYYPT